MRKPSLAHAFIYEQIGNRNAVTLLDILVLQKKMIWNIYIPILSYNYYLDLHFSLMIGFGTVTLLQFERIQKNTIQYAIYSLKSMW